VNAEAITRQPFSVTVLTLDPDTAGVRTTITDAVSDFLFSREPFIVGLSVLPRADRVTLSAVSGVVDEAASADGSTVASVELNLAGSPITAYTLDRGQKAKLAGSVTFI
jgi:hypothetical protein